MWRELTDARILVIDDERDNLELIALALKRVGIATLDLASTPGEGLQAFASNRPDIVLLDYKIPGTDGLRVLNDLRELDDADFLTPVIMLTGTENHDIRQWALSAGVADFLVRGFDLDELLLRIRNTLRTHRLMQEVRAQRAQLEEMVKTRTTELIQVRRDILERLARATEYRDDETGEHTQRVALLSARISAHMGMDEGFVTAIEMAAYLHDLGKIGVPDAILRKDSALTHEERLVIEQHPEIGAALLDGCDEPTMMLAKEVALTHHERWDGTGYPRGLSGTGIPISGRIVAVADAFDAMSTARRYRAGKTVEEALLEIRHGRGSHFDPDVVDAFLEMMKPDEHQTRQLTQV